jgi:hypothetical protein
MANLILFDFTHLLILHPHSLDVFMKLMQTFEELHLLLNLLFGL